ncbi:cytochrome b/b6 domain-containing protein [Jiangella ureilytica]|uniref:Cytochrome b/b6 domain-containing protein n=1 Tax=Jiangella ureilytica TaxID=2530374 RepID=A0A4R4RQP0_9ACTN|nr:cytochrome b/b6 domain-containing protein [Jiangella ureilytica]TDC52241.1 cytochrome b/b6 domain-containing protein [Jiangella ureilytica]
MTTEPGTPRPTVERNNARTRWLHAAVSTTVLVLLLTGWWLTLGQEGRPSPLSELTGQSDAELHTTIGWVFTGVAVLGAVAGWRAARTLLTDSVRFRRADVRWFAHWPRAVVTGRFARHEGHFDPGQRLANLALIVLLLVLIVTGIGLWSVSGGPAFVWFNRLHRWATYLFTPVIVGHVLIASGILPGYRGVWRAMHLGGRLRRRDAARVWPGWLERTDAAASAVEDEGVDGPGEDDEPRQARFH